MRGIQGMDRNVGDQCGYAKNLGTNVENTGTKCADAGNQCGVFGITVEMTQNIRGNDKLKEVREIKIIENEHICKNLVSHI